MNESGKAAPGSVKEVSIFSHAFVKGPVLFNTFDASDKVKRDPNDLDGRAKDWDADETMQAFPAIKSALAGDGLGRLGGRLALALLLVGADAHGIVDVFQQAADARCVGAEIVAPVTRG